MKKIGIITFHRALNYGAVLQSYALEKSLNKLINKDETIVEIVDYRCLNIEKFRKIKKFNILKFLVLIYKKYIFNKFLKNMKISKKIYTKNNTDKLEDDYYKFIVGSDQIWNYNNTNKDYTYLLDFCNNSNKKYSYAASIGLTDLKEEKNNYKNLLSKFNKISVRENECKKILEDLNIKVESIHLDPTLLLSKEEYIENFKLKNNNQKYILVYNVIKSDRINEILKKLSSETGLRIVDISAGKRNINIKNKNLIPSIPDFLSLFFNAEYIITNSFHGTVFSIMFNKKFIVELKKNNIGNNRIETLLDYVDLKDRIIDFNDYKNIYNEVNWDDVILKLNNKKRESIKYLEDIILK